MKLYPHQQEALSAAVAYFATHNRGKLVMASRTGKTLTSAVIARDLRTQHGLFAAPTLFLQAQSVADYRQIFKKIPILSVCSEDEVEGAQQVTTSVTEVEAWMRQHAGHQCFVFCTYQSGPTVSLASQRAGFDFDFGVFDEAHRTVAGADTLFSHLIYDESLTIHRRMFMTATERFLTSANEDEVSSMDNPALYGDTFYRLSIGAAIERGVLCDYDLVATMVTDEDLRIAVEVSHQLLQANGKTIDKRIAVAAVVAEKCLLEGLSKKMIVYMGRVSQSKQFRLLLASLLRRHRHLHDVRCLHVDGSKKIAKALTEFRHSHRAVLSNVYVVREGLDVPDCDTVMFGVPKKGTIDILQMACRALTIHQGKAMGHLVVPCLVGGVDEFFVEESFGAVKQTILAMATGDERILQHYTTGKSGKVVKMNAVTPAVFQRVKSVAISVLDEAIMVRKIRRITTALSYPNFEQARQIVQEVLAPAGVCTRKLYNEFMRKNMTEVNLPLAPSHVYAGSGWISWKHFLTGNTPSFWDYETARNWVILNISPENQTNVRYRSLHESGQLPAQLPRFPQSHYKEWQGWDAFFGRNRKSLLSYEKAQKWMRENAPHIKRLTEWRSWIKSGQAPDFLPKQPDITYKNKGWNNWAVFLGRLWLPYAEAKAFAIRNGIRNKLHWENFDKPDTLPQKPQEVYGEQWQGWNAFLGKNR